ncbi:SDR family NAD(P)-dependent oxidoreductase [Brumimicrobium aurantiacum]|uniref:SDR family NAD(P)-dependent oxidoreductase n=1 Tax=Brumimicrobium aurantiacum TaxID=1737063 RepID=A0A3E1F2H7_9FLAO|nr:SDR family NAD(P)-dependent oxidoreductase [Brumimicrobium aurantiacum]RFC55917.1 SDR family NAD(P)-dependent oxidoreductase [Brumimicrobium aurantiacum]
MIYIITGTSSGIGRALALHFLNQGNKVIGISRSNSISDENFTHISCDLSDKHQLHEISLLDHIAKEDFPIRLINNAGIIGDIKRSHELTLTHYVDMSMVNLVAPQYLCSYVLSSFGFENVETIINISSGAAQRPIPSWGAYCATKAAMDLFAETLQAEINELGQATRVYNIAPGVVDTNMQINIRKSGQKNFSSHQKFVDLKENQELRTPEEVAQLVDEFLQTDHNEKEGVIFRV